MSPPTSTARIRCRNCGHTGTRHGRWRQVCTAQGCRCTLYTPPSVMPISHG